MVESHTLHSDEKNIESIIEYRKLKRRRQQVSKKPIHAAMSYKKTLKSRNTTLIGNENNIDHYYDAAIEIEKIEKIESLKM